MTKTRGEKELIRRETSHPETYFGELDRYLNDLFHRPFSLMPSLVFGEHAGVEELSPSVDIYEEGNDLILKAELPGIRKEDLNISITENGITLTGEKKHEEKVEKKDYQWSECTYGTFTRRFRLPENVNVDKAEANFKDGVLRVRIPKNAEVETKAKKITIK